MEKVKNNKIKKFFHFNLMIKIELLRIKTILINLQIELGNLKIVMNNNLKHYRNYHNLNCKLFLPIINFTIGCL